MRNKAQTNKGFTYSEIRCSFAPKNKNLFKSISKPFAFDIDIFK